MCVCVCACVRVIVWAQPPQQHLTTWCVAPHAALVSTRCDLVDGCGGLQVHMLQSAADGSTVRPRGHAWAFTAVGRKVDVSPDMNQQLKPFIPVNRAQRPTLSMHYGVPDEGLFNFVASEPPGAVRLQSLDGPRRAQPDSWKHRPLEYSAAVLLHVQLRNREAFVFKAARGRGETSNPCDGRRWCGSSAHMLYWAMDHYTKQLSAAQPTRFADAVPHAPPFLDTMAKEMDAVLSWYSDADLKTAGLM